MRFRRSVVIVCLGLACAGVGVGAPVAAQPATPTPPPTITSLPTSVTDTPTTVPPTPAATAVPTTAPTPEPTLTIPQALDRIVSGEQPATNLVLLFEQRPLLVLVGLLLLGLLLYGGYEFFKRWTKRGIDTADRLTGGERRDLEREVRREEEKQDVTAQRTTAKAQQQIYMARNPYLERLEQEMLRLAKIPALGRK